MVVRHGWHISELKTTQNVMEQSMLNMKERDKIRISTIKKKLNKNIEVISHFLTNEMGVGGTHINRWSNRTTFWFPINQKRKRGRQPTRWSDNITEYLQSRTYHRIAIDCTEWGRLQETFALLGPRVLHIKNYYAKYYFIR